MNTVLISVHIFRTTLFVSLGQDYLAAHADDSDDDEDNGMMHLGKGFYLYRDLYNSLYAHQQQGVLWLWSLYRRKKGGILGDDMGSVNRIL